MLIHNQNKIKLLKISMALPLLYMEILFSFPKNFPLISTLHVPAVVHHPRRQTQTLRLPTWRNCLTLPTTLLTRHPPMLCPWNSKCFQFLNPLYLFDAAICTSGIGGGRRDDVEVVVDESSPPIIGWPCSASCPPMPLPTAASRSPFRRTRRTEMWLERN